MGIKVGSVSFLNTVICEDVRREASGKEILIGVFASDIMVGRYPHDLQLKVWMQTSHSKPGEINLQFRVVNQEGVEFVQAEGIADVDKIPGTGSLYIPVKMQVQTDTEFSIQAKVGDEDWSELHRIIVKKGVPPT